MYLPWILIVVSYFVGGIPVGVLVARARGVDLTQVGSRNIGASNVLRTLGPKLGALVWFVDLLKGFLPVAWAWPVLNSPSLSLEQPWPYLAGVGFAAILGHCFSPYLRFRGGRGVSTTLGMILRLDWRVALLAFVVWIFVVAVTRFISLGSLLSALSVPLLFAFLPLAKNMEAHQPYLLMGIALALLVILRHIPNIGRLVTGRETRIGERAEAPRAEGVESGPESETEYR